MEQLFYVQMFMSGRVCAHVFGAGAMCFVAIGSSRSTEHPSVVPDPTSPGQQAASEGAWADLWISRWGLVSGGRTDQ